MMHRPDQGLLREEARDQIKRALLAYAHDNDAEAVLIFAASRITRWQELLAAVQEDPADLRKDLDDIKDHLREHMRRYDEGKI